MAFNPITSSGVRCLVHNISNENVVVSGIQLQPNVLYDLFAEDPTLTETEVLGWLQDSAGPLYIETTINNRLRVVDVDFESIDSPDIIYGNQNRIVFLRSRQDVIENVEQIHLPLADAGRLGVGIGSGPALTTKGNLIGYAFTLDTDEAFKNVRIPDNYFSDGALHVNWTKSQDTDQSGKEVLWSVDYTVYSPNSGDATSVTANLQFTDTYDDAGTTSRIVYETEQFYLEGLEPGKYIALRIQAITPGGTPLAEPVLISLDFRGKFKINKTIPVGV